MLDSPSWLKDLTVRHRVTTIDPPGIYLDVRPSVAQHAQRTSGPPVPVFGPDDILGVFVSRESGVIASFGFPEIESARQQA